MLRHYGAEVVLELDELAMPTKWKWSIAELREIRDNLKAELERIESVI